jgi:nitrogen-specific signal transduction histidine kinase
MIFVSARNVTERVASDEHLRQAQKLEAMGQLTGGVAHDFNNLLTVVVSATESLSEKLRDQPGLAPQLSAIERAVERGSQLTKRLLAFARQQKLVLAPLDLNQAVQRMSMILERTLGEHIEISLKLAPGLGLVIADGAQVEDALLNLAINARDAMPGGGRLIIETENAVLDADYAAQNPDVSPGAYGAVYVTDTGAGMTPDVIARAFEPLFTTKDIGKGTGLGLSMVYGLAKQSGGHVKIYSEPGRGASVRIYLPRTGAAEGQLQEAGADLAFRAGRGERILVVEDDASVRSVAASMLTQLGYQVTLCEDGPSALQRLEAGETFDLLFSDVVMPRGMSGFDLAAEAHKRWPGIKVLLTSGYSEEFFKPKLGARPDFPLITKPYRKHALAGAVREALEPVLRKVET